MKTGGVTSRLNTRALFFSTRGGLPRIFLAAIIGGAREVHARALLTQSDVTCPIYSREHITTQAPKRKWGKIKVEMLVARF